MGVLQVMMVPQMLIMSWINFFFQGFVLSACPTGLRLNLARPGR
jgi:hypothetical protein